MLVGRTSELAALNVAADELFAGQGNVVFLTGEAGLGKTTLVREWARQLSERRDQSPLYVESACSIPIGNVDIGQLEALQPWADIIAQISRAEEEQANAKPDPNHPKKKLDLKRLIQDSAPAWAWALPVVGDFAKAAVETIKVIKDHHGETGNINIKHAAKETAASWAMAIPFVGGFAHAAMETSRLAKEQRKTVVVSAVNQQQVFQQYVNLLSAVAAQRPLVIFLDDLHWADPSSCNLLFHLSREILTKRILVVGTYRHDDALIANNGKGHPILAVRNEMRRYSVSRDIVLGYLDHDAIHAYLAARFHPYTPQKDFEEWLSKISDGNALFVTQFVSTLLDDGRLDSSGQFNGALDEVAIPESVLGVVEERTRRLDSDTGELLMYATTEGEEFTMYVLEQLTERKPLALMKDLNTASKMDMIVERGMTRLFVDRNTALFAFTHALFHKALYGQLLDAQRHYLHRKCFEVLRAELERAPKTGSSGTILASKVMMHAEKCEEWEVLAQVALESAKQMWKTFAWEETLALLNKSIGAAEHLGEAGDETRAEALLCRADVYDRRRMLDLVKADSRAAEALFRKCGLLDKAMQSINEYALASWQGRHHDEAIAECARGLEEARANGLQRAEVRFLNTTGLAFRDLSRFDEALSVLTQTLEINRQTGDPERIAGATINISTVYGAKGEYRKVEPLLREGLVYAQQAGNIIFERNARGNLAHCLVQLGRYAEAEELSLSAIASSERLGDLYGVANERCHLATVYERTRRLDEAMAMYASARDKFRAIGDHSMEGGMIINASIMMLNQRRAKEAEELALEGLKLTHEYGPPHFEANAIYVLGGVCRLLGRWEESLGYVERATAMHEVAGNRELLCTILLDGVSCLSNLDRLADARARWEHGNQLALELDMPALHVQRHYELAGLLEFEANKFSGDERLAKLREALDAITTALDLSRALRGETTPDLDMQEVKRRLAELVGN